MLPSPKVSKQVTAIRKNQLSRDDLRRSRRRVALLQVPIDRDALISLCQTYRISELSLFGSVLRNDFNPRQSDVDVLVEFLPDTPVRGFGIYDGLGILTLQKDLEKVFGRKVDLVRKEELDKYIRNDVLRRRMVICEFSGNGGVLFMPKRRETGGSAPGGFTPTVDIKSGASTKKEDIIPDPVRNLDSMVSTDAFVAVNRARKTRIVKTPDMYLLHIRDDCQRILRFTSGLTSEDFAANEEKQLAVAKLLEQIGENAGKLGKAFRKKHSLIPWELWLESRHHLVHAYEDILINTMWDTATEQIPKLLAGIETIIQEVVVTPAQ